MTIMEKGNISKLELLVKKAKDIRDLIDTIKNKDDFDIVIITDTTGDSKEPSIAQSIAALIDDKRYFHQMYKSFIVSQLEVDEMQCYSSVNHITNPKRRREAIESTPDSFKKRVDSQDVK